MGAQRGARLEPARNPPGVETHPVGLVGFHGTTWGALVEPAVTIIAQPTYEIETTAAELRLQRLEKPHRSPSKMILRGGLVVRGSSVPRQVV